MRRKSKKMQQQMLLLVLQKIRVQLCVQQVKKREVPWRSGRRTGIVSVSHIEQHLRSLLPLLIRNVRKGKFVEAAYFTGVWYGMESMSREKIRECFEHMRHLEKE